MNSRREFLGQVATGIGSFASVPRTVFGAGERIRVGVIGYGDRGSVIAREAMGCSGVQLVAASDVYVKQLERATAETPGIGVFLDHRQMLDEVPLDAVLIATPPHLHAAQFVDSVSAGKHVYIENAMAYSVQHAKQMRAALAAAKGKPVIQVGHQSCSFGQVADAAKFLTPEKMGVVTAIHASMHRNTPHGRPQWARPVYPGMSMENIAWNKFLGDATHVPFDPVRYRNWRYFWDYSGGNVYENMSHQLAFWYKVLNLQIPNAVTMTGGLYLWRDGREVPDTMSVAMEQPEQLLFTWHSSFGNSNLGMTESVLGTDGTITKGAQIRYWPEKVNRPQGDALVGTTITPPSAHMRNFLDCIRSAKETNCPFDVGFRVSIACRMAVESYHQRRTVYWDAATEEIV